MSETSKAFKRVLENIRGVESESREIVTVQDKIIDNMGVFSAILTRITIIDTKFHKQEITKEDYHSNLSILSYELKKERDLMNLNISKYRELLADTTNQIKAHL